MIWFNKKKRYTCDCCGYQTLTEKESWQICPICFWEDDMSYTNGGDPELTLYQAQQNFMAFGACSQDMKQYTREPTHEDVKDPGWEPLSEEHPVDD